jgi:DNA invertase Pin-like site-specific DNA recombinase
MRVAGYVRVSDVGGRDKQDNGRQFMSPDLQRQSVERWCNAYDHELVEVVEDLDRPGRADREQLQELVERVVRGELDGLVVAKLNRFGRSARKAEQDILRIVEAGGKFIAIEDQFDPSTTTGRFMMRILSAVAEMEVERLGDGTKAAIAQRINGGRHWGKRPRLGLELDAEGRLKQSRHAATVRQVFERYAEGEGARSLARWLRSKRITTPQGEQITTRYVRAMLRADVYVGVLRAGEHVSEHDAAIVDPELWDAVQARHQERRPRRETNLALGGLVRCWSCRHVMRAARNGGKRAYACRNERCGRPATALEERLLPLAEFTFWHAIGDIWRQRSDEDERRDRLQHEREQASRAIRNLAAATRIAELEPQEIAEQLAAWKHKRDAADRALRDLRAKDQLPQESTLRQDWPEMPMNRKRELFQHVFSAIVVQAPEKKRDHSVPVEARTRFLRRAQAGDLPHPGRKSDSLPFPELLDEYWEPTIWVIDDRDFFTPKLKPDRLALAHDYAGWLATEYGGTWG